MTALSDALVATQARAVAVLGKQYVAGTISEEELAVRLTEIGLTDTVDTSRWARALVIIREGGSEAPNEQRPQTNGAAQPMSPAQRHKIVTLCEHKGIAPPAELDDFTKVEASQSIDQLQRV